MQQRKMRWDLGLLLVCALTGCPDKQAAKAFDHCRWGQKHFKELEMASALQEFNSALGVKPGYSGAALGKALVTLASNKPTESIQMVDEVLKLSPNAPQAYQTRACAHLRLNNAAAADADHAKARGLGSIAGDNPCDNTWMMLVKHDFCQLKGSGR